MALSCGSSCCIHSQSQGRATVQQKPVEDSRAITKPEVTSVSPEVTKEFSTVGPIKDYFYYFSCHHHTVTVNCLLPFLALFNSLLHDENIQRDFNEDVIRHVKNTHCLVMETGYH